MSEYSRWSTSQLVCAPFLDTEFAPSQRAEMLLELRRRGYPRPAVIFLRALAGLGLWWNVIAWEWADLDFSDVLLGYSLNSALASIGLAIAGAVAFLKGGSAGPFGWLVLAFSVLCVVLFLAAGRLAKRHRQRHAA